MEQKSEGRSEAEIQILYLAVRLNLGRRVQLANEDYPERDAVLDCAVCGRLRVHQYAWLAPVAIKNDIGTAVCYVCKKCGALRRWGVLA